jgi:hypothetical protein
MVREEGCGWCRRGEARLRATAMDKQQSTERSVHAMKLLLVVAVISGNDGIDGMFTKVAIKQYQAAPAAVEERIRDKTLEMKPSI